MDSNIPVEVIEHMARSNVLMEQLGCRIGDIAQDVKEINRQIPTLATKVELKQHQTDCPMGEKLTVYLDNRWYPKTLVGWLQAAAFAIALIGAIYGGVSWMKMVEASASAPNNAVTTQQR